MDTELARTFLVVIATGSFVEASQRLHVTQSTVSTRIQRLEETLGAELFVRNKAGTTLTPAGQQFQRHAALLTRTVEQARQEIGIVSGFRATLTVGGRIGLWEDLLLRWLPIFASLAPDVAVRALVGLEEELMQSLIDGRCSIGVMYTPQARPGLSVELLLEEHLVWYPHEQKHRANRRATTFMSIGVQTSLPSIAWRSRASWAPRSRSTSVGSGCSAFSRSGGTGYFPARMLREHELTGRVHRVAGAPEFRLPAYLCFPTKVDSEPLALALDTIRRVAARGGVSAQSGVD